MKPAAAFLFPRASSHPSPNSSQIFAAMQLPPGGGGGGLSREPQQTVVRRGPTFVSRPGLPVAASRGNDGTPTPWRPGALPQPRPLVSPPPGS